MSLQPEEIKLYSRNKNILFEKHNERGMFDKLRTKLAARFTPMVSNSPAKVVFSERVVEYPLVFQHLDKNWRSILDFGCVEDLLPIHLTSLGYNVTGLDFRPYPFTHPNFAFIQADILGWEPPKEKYDCVISISTIEHVGLGGYGDPVLEDGDKIAVQKLLSSLKKNGRLIITVPFGKFAIERNMRVYNHEKLHELIANIEMERFFFKPGRYEKWFETTWQKINNLEYEDYYKISPVHGVAFVIVRKKY